MITGSLLLVIVIQVIVLLLSPFYKSRWPFSWYYESIFKPLLQDDRRYRWKFHLVPCFYLSLYTFIVYVTLMDVIPIVSPRLYWMEKVCLIPFLVVVTPVLGWLSMTVAPESTRRHLKGSLEQYDYDYIIYYPHLTCRTCHLDKPARSRHCNICRNCILVADHHCIWVNNCIGKGNYVYFFSFLIANVVSLSYAFMRIFYMSLTRSQTTDAYPRIIMIFNILCGTFAIICGVFTYLQLDLVRNGMTTNEKDKWYTIQEIMREGRLVKTSDNKWFIKQLPESSLLPKEQNNFYSTNSYDPRKYALKNYELVNDPSEITNIYDHGSFWQNLKLLCT